MVWITPKNRLCQGEWWQVVTHRNDVNRTACGRDDVAKSYVVPTPNRQSLVVSHRQAVQSAGSNRHDVAQPRRDVALAGRVITPGKHGAITAECEIEISA